jgi:hypothetical protein
LCFSLNPARLGARGSCRRWFQSVPLSEWRWRGRCSGRLGSGPAHHLASHMPARVHRSSHDVLHDRHDVVSLSLLSFSSFPPLYASRSGGTCPHHHRELARLVSHCHRAFAQFQPSKAPLQPPLPRHSLRGTIRAPVKPHCSVICHSDLAGAPSRERSPWSRLSIAPLMGM